MKNIFKINIILGIAAFFVSAYPMEEHSYIPGVNYLIPQKEMERNLNLFSEMRKLNICSQDSQGQFFSLCKDSPLFSDGDLALPLSVIQVIKRPIGDRITLKQIGNFLTGKKLNTKKSSIILEKIGYAIYQGVPLCFPCSFTQKKSNLPNKSGVLIKVNSSDDDYTSIFFCDKILD